MEVKLGWRSVLLILAVIGSSIGLVWCGASRATKQSAEFHRIDAERVAKTAQLEEDLQEMVALAATEKKAGVAAKARADTAEKKASAVGARLRRAKAALRKARAENGVDREPELPLEEEVVFLRDQNGLLRTSLDLRNKEATHCWGALALTEEALANKDEQYDILDQRYESLETESKRRIRKARRQGIGIGIAVSGPPAFVLGAVIAR